MFGRTRSESTHLLACAWRSPNLRLRSDIISGLSHTEEKTVSNGNSHTLVCLHLAMGRQSTTLRPVQLSPAMRLVAMLDSARLSKHLLHLNISTSLTTSRPFNQRCLPPTTCLYEGTFGTVAMVVLSCLPASKTKVKRISVANTSVLYGKLRERTASSVSAARLGDDLMV